MNTLSELDLDINNIDVQRCADLTLSSISSDMRAIFEDNTLIVGTVASNYWSGMCTAYDRSVEFQLKDLELIQEFKITQLRFDDYLWVKINQNTVYVGPDGGDKLELMKVPQFFKTSAMKVTNGMSLNSCERATTRLEHVNIDLKPYLHNGINKIWTRTIVGGYGDSAIYMAVNGTC